MSINLHTRHFLKLLDFSSHEIEYLLDLAAELKWAKSSGTEEPRMVGSTDYVSMPWREHPSGH